MNQGPLQEQGEEGTSAVRLLTPLTRNQVVLRKPRQRGQDIFTMVNPVTPRIVYRAMTYNWRGLTKPEKRIRVAHFLHGLIKPLDILCRQEHKLRSANKDCLQSLWPNVFL